MKCSYTYKYGRSIYYKVFAVKNLYMHVYCDQQLDSFVWLPWNSVLISSGGDLV